MSLAISFSDSWPGETVMLHNFGKRCNASNPVIVTGVSDTSSVCSSFNVASWATPASVTDVSWRSSEPKS